MLGAFILFQLDWFKESNTAPILIRLSLRIPGTPFLLLSTAEDTGTAIRNVKFVHVRQKSWYPARTQLVVSLCCVHYRCTKLQWISSEL